MENLTSNTAGYLYFAYGLDKQIRSMKPPYRGVDYAIKDFGHSLGLVLKEEQIMGRPQDQVDTLMEWANRVALFIESKGIKCYVIGRKSLDG
jgi:hypothetical protein